MLKFNLTPGVLPLSGTQLDSVLSISDVVWHRTTDHRSQLTTGQLREAFEGHRYAFHAAIDAAFDKALDQLPGADTPQPREEAPPVPVATDVEPEPVTVSPIIPGVGKCEVGTR